MSNKYKTYKDKLKAAKLKRLDIWALPKDEQAARAYDQRKNVNRILEEQAKDEAIRSAKK